MKLLFLCFLTYLLSSIKLGLAVDLVVNSTVASSWSSLQFLIPMDTPFNDFWSLCRRHSVYYCLDAFVTEDDRKNPGAALEHSKRVSYYKVFKTI